MIVNTQSIDIKEYGPNRIKRESTYLWKSLNRFEASYVEVEVTTTEISDETLDFQFGAGDDETFYDIVGFADPKPSQSNDFPSVDNPKGSFKYASANIWVDKDLRQINRSTYLMLDWFGDWGGLLDAMFLLAESLVYPFSLQALYNKVTAVVVRSNPKHHGRRLSSSFVQEVVSDVKTQTMSFQKSPFSCKRDK